MTDMHPETGWEIYNRQRTQLVDFFEFLVERKSNGTSRYRYANGRGNLVYPSAFEPGRVVVWPIAYYPVRRWETTPAPEIGLRDGQTVTHDEVPALLARTALLPPYEDALSVHSLDHLTDPAELLLDAARAITALIGDDE